MQHTDFPRLDQHHLRSSVVRRKPVQWVLVCGLVASVSTAHALDNWLLKAAGDCLKHASPDARLACQKEQKAAIKLFEDSKKSEPSAPTAPIGTPQPTPKNDLCFKRPESQELLCPN
jgi:hypothetical protein